jgi:hypothetical protein
MGNAPLLSILIILGSLALAIGTYVLLRRRNQPVATSGCAAIAFGTLLTVVLTGLIYVVGWS